MAQICGLATCLLLLLLLLLVAQFPSVLTSKREAIGRQLPSTALTSFRPLWSVKTFTKTQCQLLCLQSLECLAFTFLAGTSTSYCLGQAGSPYAKPLVQLSFSMLSQMTYLLVRKGSLAPYQTFSRHTIGHCQASEDCAGVGLTECRGSSCSCQKGHFYSLSKNDCVLPNKCFMAHDANFIRIQDHALVTATPFQDVLFTYDDVTRAQCTSLCVGDTRCYGVNFYDDVSKSPRCVGVGKFAIGDGEFKEENGTTWKQKICH